MTENNQAADTRQVPANNPQMLDLHPGVLAHLSPTQQGWLVLEQRKRGVFAELQNKELSIQTIPEGTTITEMENGLAAWRKLHGDLKAFRIDNWTSIIDAKLVQPAMEFEKRADPKTNTTYITRESKLLELKKAERSRYADLQAKQQEIAEYTAHVKTQREWQVMELRKHGFIEISRMYKQALTLDEPHTILNALINTLTGFAFPPGQKFQRRLVPDTEAQAIMNAIPVPDLQAIRRELVSQAQTIFANWENDKSAGTGAQSVEALSEAAADVETNFQQAAAINTLVAASESVPAVLPEGKTIKKTYNIVIVESDAWENKVLSEYLKRPECKKFMRGTQSKRTVAGFSKALAAWSTQTGNKIEGLTYEEVEK